MILPIYTDTHPLLHQPTTPIPTVTDAIRELAANMRETMHRAEGVGLAAPQVGQPISLFIIELLPAEPGDESIPFTAFINPRITWKSPHRCTLMEGCLSVPGLEGPVVRPTKIRVKATDLDGELFEVKASGIFARVIQHEYDHLQGIVFTDLIPARSLREREQVPYPTITG